MKMMQLTLIKTLFVVLASSLMTEYVISQAPIPDRPLGFVYKHAPDVPVVLEAWVDLICPDSKRAWLMYEEVADYYGPEKVRFSALIFPNPFHRSAMMAAQGAFVADELNPDLTFIWFDNVFSKQSALYDDIIYNKTQGYIRETLTSWAGEVGYDPPQFSSRLARSDDTQWLARVEFKYGGTRGIFGTPQTYVNGALVLSGPTWTLNDWKQVIDPLLNGTSNRVSSRYLKFTNRK